MDIVQLSIEFSKGEMTQALITLLLAAGLILTPKLLRKRAKSTYFETLRRPLLFIAVLFILSSLYTLFNNLIQMEAYRHILNRQGFKFLYLSQSFRIGDLLEYYRYLNYIFLSLLVLGILGQTLLKQFRLKAISLSVIVFSIFVMVLNQFSIHRASVYDQNLTELYLQD